MEASIFFSASSLAPIFRAISRAFSGDMPGIMPCFFFVVGRSEIFAVFCFDGGIIAAMTIILDIMSFDPSIKVIMLRALSSCT